MVDAADRKFYQDDSRAAFERNITSPYVWGTSRDDQPIPATIPGSELIFNWEAPRFDSDMALRDDFIAPRPDLYEENLSVLRNDVIASAWSKLVETTFGVDQDELPFPANWWPGLEVENVYARFQDAVWGGPSGPFGDIATGDIFNPNLRPEQWAAPATEMAAWDPITGESDTFFIRYDPTRAAQQFFAMDNPTRAEYNTLMAKAGLISEGWENLADYSMEAAGAFAQVLIEANYYGISAKEVLTRRVRFAERVDAMNRRGRGGSRGPTVKLEVPNYETLLVDAENAIRQAVGRDVDEWEMALVADHMQQRYGEWAAAKKKAMLGGNGTYEIPDPVKLSQDFVSDTYADEISRIEDTIDMRETNSILLDAATKGTRMMGG